MIFPSENYEALFRCVGCLNNSHIVIFNDFFLKKIIQESNKATKTQGINVCYINWVNKENIHCYQTSAVFKFVKST